MSHTTSDARKRRDSTVIAHQPGWSKEPHPGAKEDCDRCAFVAPDSPTVPRLARSVDDLRVGQWIATRGDDGWETRTVCDSLISVPYWDFDGDRVVILAESDALRAERDELKRGLRAWLRHLRAVPDFEKATVDRWIVDAELSDLIDPARKDGGA